MRLIIEAAGATRALSAALQPRSQLDRIDCRQAQGHLRTIPAPYDHIGQALDLESFQAGEFPTTAENLDRLQSDRILL